jgi:TRAP-type C4-dicarboxylate transport system permease small subunit
MYMYKCGFDIFELSKQKMSDALGIFYSFLMMTTMIHCILLVIMNKVRILKLVKFIDTFYHKDLLSNSDYEFLNSRYRGFFSYLEFYPDRNDFHVLYEDRGFDRFVKQFKKRLTYLAVVTAIGLVLIVIIGFAGTSILTEVTS